MTHSHPRETCETQWLTRSNPGINIYVYLFFFFLYFLFFIFTLCLDPLVASPGLITFITIITTIVILPFIYTCLICQTNRTLLPHHSRAKKGHPSILQVDHHTNNGFVTDYYHILLSSKIANSFVKTNSQFILFLHVE